MHTKIPLILIYSIISILIILILALILFNLFIQGEEKVRLTPYVLKTDTKTNKNILKVFSLNIAHGRGDKIAPKILSKKKVLQNLDLIANCIKRVNPDIIAYQEIDEKSFWNADVNLLKYMAYSTDMPYSIQGKHVHAEFLSYGTALSSKYKILNAFSYTFPTTLISFPKGFTTISINYPENSSGKIEIISLHLDFLSSKQRTKQIHFLLSRLNTINHPLIIMGDFNCSINDKEKTIRLLLKELNLKTYKPDSNNFITYPFNKKRIDWILISKELHFQKFEIIKEKISDHFGIYAEISEEPVL